MPDLLQNVANEVKVIRQSLPPSPVGVPTGYALRVVDSDSGTVDWQQSADSPVLEGSGDPNTVYRGHLGQLYVDKSVPPALWQNSDGYKAWTAVSGASNGASGRYNTGGSTTSVPDSLATKLPWPTLTLGTALLDLTTPTQPTVLTAGTYTFNVSLGATTPGTDATYVIEVIDPVTSFASQVSQTSVEANPSESFTSFLNAGSVVEVGVIQTSGGALSYGIIDAQVTKS